MRYDFAVGVATGTVEGALGGVCGWVDWSQSALHMPRIAETTAMMIAARTWSRSHASDEINQANLLFTVKCGSPSMSAHVRPPGYSLFSRNNGSSRFFIVRSNVARNESALTRWLAVNIWAFVWRKWFRKLKEPR